MNWAYGEESGFGARNERAKPALLASRGKGVRNIRRRKATESVNGLEGRAQGMPGMMGEKGPEMSIWSWGGRPNRQATSVVLIYILMCMGPFLVFLVNSPVLWNT